MQARTSLVIENSSPYHQANLILASGLILDRKDIPGEASVSLTIGEQAPLIGRLDAVVDQVRGELAQTLVSNRLNLMIEEPRCVKGEKPARPKRRLEVFS